MSRSQTWYSGGRLRWKRQMLKPLPSGRGGMEKEEDLPTNVTITRFNYTNANILWSESEISAFSKYYVFVQILKNIDARARIFCYSCFKIVFYFYEQWFHFKFIYSLETCKEAAIGISPRSDSRNVNPSWTWHEVS